ncbi:IclR family transcriptional regulator [uncultured Hydrogenophaga sp.]|uniref:IclR family transcriptional regulator n=1 Tax=uncultured Hydrogenophaga sp. TaxID=199683 RepID=UPI0025870E6C|nr:IclR family transcriptional regulator [uncultured Hydrogenophaga sp.]
MRNTEGAQSIRRAAALLRVVAMAGDRGTSLSSVTQVSGLHKATVHRILRVLFEEGLLEFDEQSKQYRIGAEIYALSRATSEKFDIGALAQSSLDKLCHESGDTVYFAVRSGYDALCLGMAEGSHPEKALRLNLRDRWPLGVGAFSMALLAFLPDPEMHDIVRHTAARLGHQDQYTEERLLKQVADARLLGYAVTQILAYPPSCAIGVPVRDHHDRPIASLCITAVATRMDETRRRQLARKMMEEARAISDAWSSLRGGGGGDNWQRVAHAVRTVQTASANGE